jgi:hypothetical protein
MMHFNKAGADVAIGIEEDKTADGALATMRGDAGQSVPSAALISIDFNPVAPTLSLSRDFLTTQESQYRGQELPSPIRHK